MREINHTAKATIKAEVDSIDRRLQAVGIRKVLRDVFGRTKTDSTMRAQLQATLTNIEKREREARQALERRQKAERAKEARRQAKNRDRLEKGVRTARGRREADDWKPRQSQRGTKRTGRPDRKKTAKHTPAPSKAQETAPTARQKDIKPNVLPEVKPSDAPDLADLKRAADNKLDRLRNESPLRKLWDKSRQENAPRRQRDEGTGRTRRPSSPSRGRN